MLSTIRIECFKSISELELDLGRINLFIGANGSGKSNLLEAIGVLGAAASGRVDDESLLRRGIRPGVPRLYRAAFPDTISKSHILFEARTGEGALYRITLWNPIQDPSPAWKFKTEALHRADGTAVASRGPALRGLNQEQGLAALRTVELAPGDEALSLIDDLRNYSIYCPNTPALRILVPDGQARKPVGLAGGRLPEAVKELLDGAKKDSRLADLLDQVTEMVDWCNSFSAVPSAAVPLSPSAMRSPLVIQFVDRFMTPRHNKLSGYDASEGALYILFCAVLALHQDAPPILAIDNFDQALNPRLARSLMTALCGWLNDYGRDRQWLLTAHNPAVLDGLPLDNPDVRLFAVERDSNGHTRVSPIDLDTAIRKRPSEEWTLSRMWMNGYLGAVPNV